MSKSIFHAYFEEHDRNFWKIINSDVKLRDIVQHIFNVPYTNLQLTRVLKRNCLNFCVY